MGAAMMEYISSILKAKPRRHAHQHDCIDCLRQGGGPYECPIKKPKSKCHLENAERCLKHYLAWCATRVL